jgi:hypothetical protein
MGHFFSLSHFSPLFSEAFALGDVMPPPHSPPLHSGAAVSPIAKAKKTTGLPLNSSKKCPMPVKGYKVWKGQGGFCYE